VVTVADEFETPGTVTVAPHTVTAVLVPSVATTQLVFRPLAALLVGVKVVEAVPPVLVVLLDGDTVPAPVPPTVQLMGRPDSSEVVVPPTETVAVYGEPPAVNAVVVGLRLTVIDVAGSME